MKLELPTLQNWSCHNCSGCCHQHLIEITEEERTRIEQQGWSESEELKTDQPVIVSFRSGLKTSYRLAHQSNGACVFLMENGLCRIHAKFGEHAKPLACRVYPYAYHPAGNNITVSLRFSCPSVVENLGISVKKQKPELQQIAQQLVPVDFEKMEAPKVHKNDQVSWKEFLKLPLTLKRLFQQEEKPFLTKLTEAIHFVDLIEETTLSNLQSAQVSELMDLLRESVALQVQEEKRDEQRPGRTAQMIFRMICARYCRKDTVSQHKGIRERANMLLSAFRFARGKGEIPRLQESLPVGEFSKLEQSFGILSSEENELWTRYFLVKIPGLHFCGPSYYNYNFVEGFRSFLLIFPVTMWLSRWIASGKGRSHRELKDLQLALTISDHQHGYSPAFASASSRRNVRILHQLKEISKLCLWYGM